MFMLEITMSVTGGVEEDGEYVVVGADVQVMGMGVYWYTIYTASFFPCVGIYS